MMEKARVFADETVRFKIAAWLRILYNINCKNLGTLEKFIAVVVLESLMVTVLSIFIQIT